MAEDIKQHYPNIKPYNPNKSWIELKLNPDLILDELGNLIPYRHTIGMIDSEVPWSEVGKSAIRETPILGSIISGEPLDAIKEAFLFGFPIKVGKDKAIKVNKEINKNPNREYYNYNGDLYYKDKFRGKDKYINAYDKLDRISPDDWSKATNTYKYNDYKQVLEDIDASRYINDYISKPTQPTNLSLENRSEQLHKLETDINDVNDFSRSHDVKGKEIYKGTDFDSPVLIVNDPVSKTTTQYWVSRPLGQPNIYDVLRNRLNYDDFNKSISKYPNQYIKVDDKLRNTTRLERKLLNSEAKKLNIEMDLHDVIGNGYIPAEADNIFKFDVINRYSK